MLENCLVDIIVDDNSEGVKFLLKRHPRLTSAFGLTPDQAIRWLNGVVIPIGIDYITYIDRGYGLGMGRTRPILDEDGPSSKWTIPPIMEDYINSLPLVIFEMLKEHWLAGINVLPINPFVADEDTVDIRLVAYLKEQ